jgi:two-component system chemotaxis sensor kinase CheA
VNEVVREFLLETHENLAQLDLDLVTLEKDPGERETLSRVFRTLHTVKGTAGFLGLAKLQAVSHGAETLLSKLRSGELVFDQRIASSMLAVVDAVRTMTASIEATGAEGEGDYSHVIQLLDELSKAAGSSASTPSARSSFLSPDDPALGATGVFESPPSLAAEPLPQVDQTEDDSPDAVASAAIPTSVAPKIADRPPPARSSRTELPGGAQDARGAASVSDTAIRVDVGLLDKLMNLVGELVLARNQISQFSASQEDGPFLGAVQRLNLLTTELQTSVMKTRMQPIGNVWSKFPRIVRDLSIACGKQVQIELEGQETELDKTIIEAIRDPLTHMVRNAVDHGIESPADRIRNGKPAEGRLRLHAFHEGGKVIIEVNDDGSGIDPKRVKEKALRNKIVTPEQAARMNEREVLNLIFLPGFSTADRVTQFSGRGVGMDVVRTNIERIGGSVDVESRLGRGSTFKLKIPLTLAIIPALTVSSGGERFAIPQVSLLELVRLEGEQAKRGVERIHGAPVYRLRGNLLPLIYLDRELELPSARSEDRDEVTIVVLQADDRHFGLVVDVIHDTQEIVVKPLQKQVKSIPVFSGATIMGDGQIALILDVLGLALRSQVVAGARERAQVEKAAVPASDSDQMTLLLFAVRNGGRIAIPLDAVSRLEEVPRSAVERVGRSEVVQYRGEILPLLRVSNLVDVEPRRARVAASRRARSSSASESLPVVVCSRNGRSIGLVVGRILDIVQETAVARTPATRPGVLFSAIVQGKVTEFLDVDAVLGASVGAAPHLPTNAGA